MNSFCILFSRNTIQMEKKEESRFSISKGGKFRESRIESEWGGKRVENRGYRNEGKENG